MPATWQRHPKGGLVGGTLGYNLQTGVWVWGIEGDFDVNWIKGTATAAFCASCGFETRTPGSGPCVAASAMPSIAGCPISPAVLAYGNMKMDAGTGVIETKTQGRLDRWAAASNTPSWARGRPSSNISTSISARRPAARRPARWHDIDVTFKASLVRLGVNYRF